MDDRFNAKLFELAIDSPDLQQALLNGMMCGSNKYSIPTGDITVSVFEDDNEKRQQFVKDAIHIARDLTVKDLARMLAELRVDLILKEVQGETLPEWEKTLRDIDITHLAVFTLILWSRQRNANRKTET